MSSIKQIIENKTILCEYTKQEVTIQTRKHGILKVVMSITCNKCSSNCPKECPYVYFND